MWGPRLGSLAVMIGSAVMAYFLFIGIVAMETPGTEPFKNPFELAMAFAVIVFVLVSYAGLWGIITSFLVEPADRGSFKFKQNMLTHLLKKVGAGDCETFCGTSLVIGLLGTLVIFIATSIGIYASLGTERDFAILVQLLKMLGTLAGATVGVLAALWTLLWFANKSPKIGGAIAVAVGFTVLGFIINDVYSTMTLRGLKEIGNILLAIGIVGWSTWLLFFTVKRLPGHQLICPLNVNAQTK